MASAELEQTTAEIAVAGRDGKAYGVRATGSVVQFDGFLKLYEEGRDEEDEEEPLACRRSPRVIGSPTGLTRPSSTSPSRRRASARRPQAHGGARHRPPLHLRLDARRDRGPRLRAHRQEAAHPRGQRAARHRLPGELLQALRRVRLHRRPGGEARPHLQRRPSGARCCATSGATSRRPSARSRTCASATCSRR